MNRKFVDVPLSEWVFWLIVAALCYSFVPDNLKGGYLLLIVLGGLVWVEKYGGGLQPFIDRLQGKGL